MTLLLLLLSLFTILFCGDRHPRVDRGEDHFHRRGPFEGPSVSRVPRPVRTMLCPSRPAPGPRWRSTFATSPSQATNAPPNVTPASSRASTSSGSDAEDAVRGHPDDREEHRRREHEGAGPTRSCDCSDVHAEKEDQRRRRVEPEDEDREEHSRPDGEDVRGGPRRRRPVRHDGTVAERAAKHDHERRRQAEVQERREVGGRRKREAGVVGSVSQDREEEERPHAALRVDELLPERVAPQRREQEVRGRAS